MQIFTELFFVLLMRENESVSHHHDASPHNYITSVLTSIPSGCSHVLFQPPLHFCVTKIGGRGENDVEEHD